MIQPGSINVGSMDGIHVPTILPGGTFAYSASKAGAHHLTRTLAIELATRHITVNAIAPGYFESKMTAQVLAEHRSGHRGGVPTGTPRNTLRTWPGWPSTSHPERAPIRPVR